MTTRKYQPFRPAWSSSCLCGSGKAFRDCCHGRLPDKAIGERWHADAEAEKWPAAIRAIRADVTQYTIWHLSHTAPIKSRQPQFRGMSLMKIDVEALSAHVDTLTRVYRAAGKHEDIPAMLDRLRGNIDDPAWHAKIAYHKTIDRLLRADRDGAANELAKAGPISAKSDDVDLLQAKLDLHGSEMGLTEHLGFLDRIIELTSSRSDNIQYAGARAFQLLMAGDEKGGLEALQDVVRQGREMEANRRFGAAIEIWFCRALEGVAVMTHERRLFDEIIERLERLRASPNLAPEGRAHINRSIGDAYRYSGRFEPAIIAYREAYDCEPEDVLLVFEAECQLRSGDSEEALNLLRLIDPSKLDRPEHADFAFGYFFVALAQKDPEALRAALDFLKSTITPQPYFEKLRLSYIITAQDALTAIAEKRPIPKPKGLTAFLRNISRYIMLQPNVGGIGINLNNALDDFTEQRGD